MHVDFWPHDELIYLKCMHIYFLSSENSHNDPHSVSNQTVPWCTPRRCPGGCSHGLCIGSWFPPALGRRPEPCIPRGACLEDPAKIIIKYN